MSAVIPAPFQVLRSHMWLAATVLDNVPLGFSWASSSPTLQGQFCVRWHHYTINYVYRIQGNVQHILDPTSPHPSIPPVWILSNLPHSWLRNPFSSLICSVTSLGGVLAVSHLNDYAISSLESPAPVVFAPPMASLFATCTWLDLSNKHIWSSSPPAAWIFSTAP